MKNKWNQNVSYFNIHELPFNLTLGWFISFFTVIPFFSFVAWCLSKYFGEEPHLIESTFRTANCYICNKRMNKMLTQYRVFVCCQAHADRFLAEQSPNVY